MRNAWLWLVLAIAVGAVAWFLVGEELLLGAGSGPESDFSHDANLIGRDDAVTLEASGTGPRKAKKTVDPAETAPADPMALGGFVVRGRVVDEERRPVQSEISASFPGREPVRMTTGADGRFEVALGEVPGNAMQVTGSIHASAPGDLVALHQFWVWTSMNAKETDAGVVVLRKGQTLAVRATNGGTAVPNARIAVFGSGTWGNRVLFIQGTADDDGVFTTPVLPPGGSVALAAGGVGTGRGSANVTIPRRDTSKPLDIELTDERVLDVEVVDKESGSPVANARILLGDRNGVPPPLGEGYLPELTVPPTDEQGRTTIQGLGTEKNDRLTLTVVAEGYPASRGGWGPGSRINQKRVKADEQEVRIELVRLRTVTFSIKAGDVPAPPEGAPLKVTEQSFGIPSSSDAVTATIKEGELEVQGLQPGHVSGTVSDEKTGVTAAFQVKPDKTEGNPVTFQKGYALHVRLLDTDGQPAVGKNVVLQQRNAWKMAGPVKTDEKGEAQLPPTDLKSGDIKLLTDPSQWWNAVTLDSIDLTKHEGIKVVKLRPETKLTIALRLDGKARLPTNYWLNIGGRYINPNSAEERPDTGEIVVPYRLPDGDKPLKVQISADGHLPGNKDVPREDLGKPILLELKPSATIVVRYTKPEDGRFSLMAQRWDAKKETWQRAHSNMSFNRPQQQKEENTQRFEGLTAGRYRVMDWQSKLTSDEFDVELGGPPAEVHMDLSVLTYTEGRVEVPDGFDFHKARVQRTSEKKTTSRFRWRGGATGVKKDGTFRFRSVRGEPLELTVTHPLLVAAKTGGIVATKGGSQNVVLKLETGSEIRFKVAGLDLEGSKEGSSHVTERVMLGDGEIITSMGGARVPVTFRVYEGGTFEGEPLRRGSPIAEEGVLRVGGLKPGTYSFFFERPNHAPKRVRGVELGKGVKDLGVLDFNKGSTITIKLVAAEGKPVPNVWANAKSVDKPEYARHAGNGGKDTLTFKGLGAGQFKVQVNASGGFYTTGGAVQPKLYDKEVSVDGSNDITITVEAKE